MKILVIDGQGGKIGKTIIEKLKSFGIQDEIVAVGTNSIATSAMLNAGADGGATGENPVLVNCRDADYIIGPIGILCADALYGEVSPAMSIAIGQSNAKKILLPINRCNNFVVGVQDLPLSEMVRLAVEQVIKN